MVPSSLQRGPRDQHLQGLGLPELSDFRLEARILPRGVTATLRQGSQDVREAPEGNAASGLT